MRDTQHRKFKRYEAKMGMFNPVEEAMGRGDDDGYAGVRRHNPFPRGCRRVAYNDGFAAGQRARRAEAVVPHARARA